MKEINQISIYLKENKQKVNEVSLAYPLRYGSEAQTEAVLAKRTWNYNSPLPFLKKAGLKIQKLLCKYLPRYIPSDRLTAEAKFKTVLALLLAQEEVRDFFLHDPSRRKKFLLNIQHAAVQSGYLNLELPNLDMTPLDIACQLTRVANGPTSLIHSPLELNQHMAALRHQEKCELLSLILNQVERPPILSVVEITGKIEGTEQAQSIQLTTQYAQYKILDYDARSGRLSYSYKEDHATSSIRTKDNCPPDAIGAINQRAVFETMEHQWISSYCGKLETPFNVLEQLLLIVGEKNGSLMLHEQCKERADKKKILFTSLYSWDEYALITDQREALRKWNRWIVQSNTQTIQLHLLYFNIPFNALNKFPSPAEIRANMEDLNDEALLTLCSESWSHLGLHCQPLEQLAHSLSILNSTHLPFLQREKAHLEAIDHFRQIKKGLIQELLPLKEDPFKWSMLGLLSGKKPDGKQLKGMDKLLYLSYVAQELGYCHNKNSRKATDRIAGADAADKAQFAYWRLSAKPYLPGYETREEKELFSVLYSLYLVCEEPEINTWLSTGFIGEKFHKNFLQKNPETTRYLTKWLKSHPEIYLGLSRYRK